jgi:hypothetical protein
MCGRLRIVPKAGSDVRRVWRVDDSAYRVNPNYRHLGGVSDAAGAKPVRYRGERERDSCIRALCVPRSGASQGGLGSLVVFPRGSPRLSCPSCARLSEPCVLPLSLSACVRPCYAQCLSYGLCRRSVFGGQTCAVASFCSSLVLEPELERVGDGGRGRCGGGRWWD